MTKSEILNPTKKHKRNFKILKRNFVKKSDPIKKLLENHKNNVEESKEIGLLKRKNYIKFFNGGLINLSKEERNIVYSLLSKDIAVLATMLLLHINAESGRLTMLWISQCLEGIVSEDAVRTSILKLDRLGLIKKGKSRYIKANNKRSTIVYEFPIWDKYFNYIKRKCGCAIYDQTMDSLVTEQPRNLSGNKLNINNDTSKADLKDLISEFMGSLKLKPKPKPLEEFIPYSVEQPRIYTNAEMNFAAMPFEEYQNSKNWRNKKIGNEFWSYDSRSKRIIDKITGKSYETIATAIFENRKRRYTLLEMLIKVEGGYVISKEKRLIEDKIYTRRTTPWGMEKAYENSIHDEFKVKRWGKFISDSEFEYIREFEHKSDKPYHATYKKLNVDDLKYYLGG